MAKKEQDSNDQLWAVVFEYYPNFKFTSEAQEIFYQKITKWLWVICQDGSIENEKSKRKKMILIIDLEDENTLRSMNLLPKFLKQGFGITERASWGARVYDKDDPGWTDIVRVDAKGCYFLESLENAWEHFRENLDDLKRDVKKISASLKPKD